MPQAVPPFHAAAPAEVRRSRIGWRRTPIPGSGIPEPESRRRLFAIRAIALVALAVSAVYLGWRIAFTIDPDSLWLSIPLVVLEVHAAIGLSLFTFSLWDVDRRAGTRPVTGTDDRVAVLIPTYNEGIEVLMPAIAAAVAMRVNHETWVLDDGDRPEIGRLAADLGARYLTRPVHDHAKAGNLNHALERIDADLVAVLDADHVASPDFLVRTLGYFDDPSIAVVQTPQDFYNRESFEHEATTEEDAQYHEQVLFYRVIQPGKNRWNAAFWCGTGAVVRVAALREVGGVATDTITEDIHTTIRLHRRGWRTVYHNEILARGLAASDAETYQLQRLRWGTGAMQVLKTENPLVVPGLSLGQRVAYAATLLGWFDAWRSLGYLLAPIAVVVTGAVPIRAEPTTFAVAFGTTFVLQQLAMRVLSRGCHRPVLSILFELIRMTSNVLATLTLVTRRRPSFRVTPKGRTGDGRRRSHVPLPLQAVMLLSVLGTAWFALTLLGVTPTVYTVPWAVYAAFGWLLGNFALVVLAIRRIRAPRFAAERRSAVRFETRLAGEVDGTPADILDVSLTGARVALATVLEEAARHTLEIEIGGDRVPVAAEVRGHHALEDGTTIYGLEFVPGQHRDRARLALGLFGTRIQPVADRVRTELPALTRRAAEAA